MRARLGPADNDYWVTNSAVLTNTRDRAEMLLLMQGQRGEAPNQRLITATVQVNFERCRRSLEGGRPLRAGQAEPGGGAEVSPRRKVDPDSEELFRLPDAQPRRWVLPLVAGLAAVAIIAALTVSTLLLVKRETQRQDAIRDVAVLSFVRGFVTQYASIDPFHANDYADRVLAQGTGHFAKLYPGQDERGRHPGGPGRADDGNRAGPRHRALEPRRQCRRGGGRHDEDQDARRQDHRKR